VTDLVVVDADVLGRERTGDETYVRNLLRELPEVCADAGLRVAAVTRHPEHVPEGVEAVELSTSSQELRMSWTLPRTLRRLDAALVHTQYAVPVRCPCPAVVTVHDLSFERDASLMKPRDRAVFRRVVPRAVRRASRVLTVSERTKSDLVELYDVEPGRIVVTPNGVDPAFHPGETDERGYVLTVGAIQPRKDQLTALAAAQEAGLPLVVVGPTRDQSLEDELRRRGARVEGYVPIERLAELYRGAACLVQASRYEGFGLPALEAMASGTPVVTVPDPALVEVVGDAAVIVEPERLADGIRSAIADRDRLAWAGLERARAFSWRATAEATVAVYRDVLGVPSAGGDG
jgi:glycosyltransferase involved in cell wall biosynthesis